MVEERTVANTMVFLATIVAKDLHYGQLNLVLGATLRHVAELIAVAALGKAARHGLSGVFQALQVLGWVLRPELTLTRARRIPLQAVSDGIFLAQVTLQVHVGQGHSQRFLDGNEPQRDVLSAECLLELFIGRVGGLLRIGLNGRLRVVDIALLGGFLDECPGLLGRHVREIRVVDLARTLALADSVS
jgi:hypothetical protein